MIDKYRIPSQKKWDRIIRAIDDGEEWDEGDWNFPDIEVNESCGYCDYSNEKNALSGSIKSACYYCPLPVNQICCNASGEGLYKDFLDAMDAGDRTQARAIAVKIRDYIRDDK
jgi:hypothetical protein